MGRRASPLPPGLDRPFTVAEARDHGVGAARLRRADLTAPLRGIRIPRTAPADLTELCRVVLRLMPPGSVLSHGTALRLLGVDLPSSLDDGTVHVSVPASGRRPERRGIVTHAVAAALPHRTVAGLPVSTPEHAWLGCAASADVDTLVVLADALVRRRDPLIAVEHLRRVVEQTRPGTRGLARARAALPDVRERTDSLMETRTRLVLVRHGLPCPDVNVPVLDQVGGFVAMPDLTYRAARIAIEYDGDVHRTDRRVWMRDIRRREGLQAAGWLVMTVTADDVLRDPEPLVGRVRAALTARSRP